MNTMSAEERAVALLYEGTSSRAPKVVASGRGEIARKMVKIAAASGVEIVEDPDLVDVLSQVPLGAEIPLELYQAVAEILAFVYQANRKHAERSTLNSSDLG